MGVEPKIEFFTPKMDGKNNGKAYEQMDDLGVPLFFAFHLNVSELDLVLGNWNHNSPNS